MKPDEQVENNAPKEEKSDSKSLAEAVVAKYPDLKDPVDVLVNWQNGVKWELIPQFKNEKNIPRIMDFADSIFTLLLNDNKSLIRFGDGELGIMAGTLLCASAYQSTSDRLISRLVDILKDTSNDNIQLALTKAHAYTSSAVVKGVRTWAAYEYVKISKKGNYFKFFDPDYLYADAHVSGVDHVYTPTSSPNTASAFYALVKKLIATDVILVTGQGTFKEYKHKLSYDFATSVTEVCVPAKNAYSCHDDIKQTLLDINGGGSRLVLLACGPEAKLLAYDLCDKMRCLDIGHMLADYNDFKRGSRTPNFWFQ